MFFTVLAGGCTTTNEGRVGVATTKGCSCNSNAFTRVVLPEMEEVTEVLSQHFLCGVWVLSSSPQQVFIAAQGSFSLSAMAVRYCSDTDDKVFLQ